MSSTPHPRPLSLSGERGGSDAEREEEWRSPSPAWRERAGVRGRSKKRPIKRELSPKTMECRLLSSPVELHGKAEGRDHIAPHADREIGGKGTPTGSHTRRRHRESTCECRA